MKPASDGTWPKLTERQLQALRLVNCGSGMGLTHRANTLISRQAKSLLALGLIDYAPERCVAYRLTLAGERALAGYLDGHRHANTGNSDGARASFVNRADLPESAWPRYEEAYTEAYAEVTEYLASCLSGRLGGV